MISNDSCREIRVSFYNFVLLSENLLHLFYIYNDMKFHNIKYLSQ